MSKIVTVLALSAALAAPSFALDRKEAADKNRAGADGKVAAADEKRAHDLWVRAAARDADAKKHWEAASRLWEARQKEIHDMYVSQAEARADRNAAQKLNHTAQNLITAEHLRAQAFNDRLAADQLHKNAYAHQVNANAAKAAVTDGEKALNDLKPVAAKFGDAIRDITADVNANKAKEQKEEAAAKSDTDVANKLVADAAAKEQRASSLEKAPAPAAAIVVKAPARPAPIVAKGNSVPKH